MFSASTTVSLLGIAFVDIGTVLSLAIVTLLTGMVAFMGLAFGVGRLGKYITGGGEFISGTEYAKWISDSRRGGA